MRDRRVIRSNEGGHDLILLYCIGTIDVLRKELLEYIDTIREEYIVIDTILRLDFTITKDPKYIVLIQSMRAAIRSGQLKSGHRLPPVRDLAWSLKITPGTVARAYKLAAEEGLVETAVGRGTFVTGGMITDAQPPEPLINVVQSDFVDFRAVRVPDFGQGKVIRRLMLQLGKADGHGYTDYPTCESDLAAREAVVGWIGPDRIGRLSADDIVLGLGAQNSVIMALQAVLHGPNPVIITEALAYPGVRHAARFLRAQLIGVEMDSEGMRPDRLEEVLRRYGGQVLLTSAQLHSPTTIRATLTRRQEIAEVARRYQLQIIEDDCHCITRPEEPAYRGICPERAWYISSLTKAVSGSLRFGFSAAPKGQAAMARQVAQSSFYGLPQPILDICAELLTSGEAERIRAQVEQLVLDRARIAVNIMGQWDIAWRPDAPFLWLKLPQGWRGSTFARACEKQSIRIKPADEFALPDGHAPHAVRISLNAQIPVAEFEVALRIISDLLSQPPTNVDL